MTDRTITWPGAYNIRDLGGLALKTGGETVFGRAYRAGRLEYLTDDGWHAAIDAGLSGIIDLRNNDEHQRRDYDHSVDEALVATIEHFPCPAEDVDNAEFIKLHEEVGYDHPRAYPLHLSHLPENMVRIFRAIAQADRPLLFHCQQGRDRTGLVASLVLSLNGVTLDAIGADFELAARSANENLFANPSHSSESAKDETDLGPWIAERRETLVGWIDSVDVADYLLEAGMPADELEAAARLLV